MLSTSEKREFEVLKKSCYTPEKYKRYIELYKKSLNGCTEFRRNEQWEPYQPEVKG